MIGPEHRRWPFVVTLMLGLGLALAPAAFSMFDRAPKGAVMIDEFRPYMNDETITGFQDDLADIDAAATEGDATLIPLLEERAGLDEAAVDEQFASYATFDEQWPSIDEDMSDMLTTMEEDLGGFAGVDALPPFTLFPWFFVAPGVLVAGVSVWALVRQSRGRSTRAPATALIVLGVGILAAPAVFQMFSRAPGGGDMIDDFRPLMTTEKVQRIQGYFLVIGAGEGTLRNQVLPALEAEGGLTPAQIEQQLPAIDRFSVRWPGASSRMAPMIGAMSDNVDNYEAVDALPPFSLFPWFFVIPGLAIATVAFVAHRGSRTVNDTQNDTQGDIA